jgi:segregation and condensation protein A
MLQESALVEFVKLFRPEEGRLGVCVTFAALLELLREGLIDVVQAEPYAPLHVRRAERNLDAHELDDVEITTAS